MKIVWIVAGILIGILLLLFLLACIGIVGVGLEMETWERDR